MRTIKIKFIQLSFFVVVLWISSCHDQQQPKSSGVIQPVPDKPDSPTVAPSHQPDSLMSADSSLSKIKAMTSMIQGDATDSVGSGNSSSQADTGSNYHTPLPDDYIIPVTGNGTGVYLQYFGGGIFNNQKDGVSFSISATPQKTGQWNVYFKGFGKFAQMGIAAHYSFLLNDGFTRTILNDDHQVYSSEKAAEKIRQANYTVSDIQVENKGTEKVHGFDCVHARITAVSRFMNNSSRIEMDLWRSPQPPGSSLLESSIQTLISPFTVEMEDKLQQINCKGTVIKVVIQQDGSKLTKELYSIAKKDFPSSYFSIPADYREDKNTELYFLYK